VSGKRQCGRLKPLRSAAREHDRRNHVHAGQRVRAYQARMASRDDLDLIFASSALGKQARKSRPALSIMTSLNRLWGRS